MESIYKLGIIQRIGGLTVMEVSGGVWRGVTPFLPRKRKGRDLHYVENQRRGVLLWAKK